MSTNKNGDLFLLQCEPQEMKLRMNGIPMSSYMNYKPVLVDFGWRYFNFRWSFFEIVKFGNKLMSLVDRKEILNILISFVFTNEHSSVLDLRKARRIQHCSFEIFEE